MSEEIFMKKHGLILIPILIGSLVGCKQGGSSQVDADFKKAKNLKFDEKYATKLTTPTEVNVYGRALDVFNEKGLTTKSVVVSYDEMTYATDHIADTVARHTTYTLYKDYAIQSARTTKTDRLLTDTNKTYKNVHEYEFESYYDDDHQTYFTHSYGKGGHYLEAVNLSSYSAEHIHNYIASAVDDASNNGFYHLTMCEDFYEKKNGGYVGFYEDTYDDPDGHDMSRYQIICELDKSFKLTKSTFFYEYYEKYDYVHDQETTKLRRVMYTHEIREVTYGSKKAESVIASNIQKMYGKPYIEYGYLSYINLGTCDYTDSIYQTISPEKIHLEGFIFFDEFTNQAIDVTPTIDVCTLNSMYDDTSHYFEIDGTLSIKNSKYFKYYKGQLQYHMKNIMDAIWFKIDCTLNSKNEVKFKSGSVEIVDRDTLESYLESFYA